MDHDHDAGPLLFGEIEIPCPCPSCHRSVIPDVESRLLENGTEVIVLRCPSCGFVPPHTTREAWRGESSRDAVRYALWGPWFDAYLAPREQGERAQKGEPDGDG
ncbi:hypothetical protein [Oceanithermus sp.]|uniref:hypothetical protein n=1 Tax=Oceanithermus sp. TaxID=2268145 RepID=UPI00257BCF16|nr:hypothetical protein [Oceanithermus sp.]